MSEDRRRREKIIFYAFNPVILKDARRLRRAHEHSGSQQDPAQVPEQSSPDSSDSRWVFREVSVACAAIFDCTVFTALLVWQ